MVLPKLEEQILRTLKQGVVIPACPLALDSNRKLDETHQQGLIRYYTEAGAGGVAVGVHTTQFEIRDPGIDLFKPLLELTYSELEACARTSGRTVIKIAGVCGRTEQALDEAEFAASTGYDMALLSLSALQDASDAELIEHCKAVSQIIPLMGFYLQPAVGGRVLPFSFWCQFAEIENAYAVKIAPFNRYQTIDVVRAVAAVGRQDEITLYTGNDDNIIVDLLTPFTFKSNNGEECVLHIKGGLLGQWSIWTRTAVRLLEQIHRVVEAGEGIPLELMEKHIQLTDANAVVFDAANRFAGCIPGINEVLRRQGLLAYSHCLDPELSLSPGQAEQLDRINRDYPWLPDDEFITQQLLQR